jgi:hypothetical protein
VILSYCTPRLDTNGGNDLSTNDLDRIRDFVISNARLLDRRRMELAVGGGDPDSSRFSPAIATAMEDLDGGWSQIRVRRPVNR